MTRIATISVANTTTGTSASNPYPVNWKSEDYGIGMGLRVTDLKGGTVDIEHTFDDPKVGLSNWFKHATLTGKTTSADGNYAYPITAVRMFVSGATASAVKYADLDIVQG